MAEIVNLNRHRKAMAKAVAEAKAEANRISFGRKRSDKEAAEKLRDKVARELDGKKLED